MAHRDPVVDGDRVELAGDAARRVDRLGDDLSDRLEVGMTGNELRVRVRDGDDRFAEVLPRDAGGAEEGASTCHVAPVGDGS